MQRDANSNSVLLSRSTHLSIYPAECNTISPIRYMTNEAKDSNKNVILRKQKSPPPLTIFFFRQYAFKISRVTISTDTLYVIVCIVESVTLYLYEMFGLTTYCTYIVYL